MVVLSPSPLSISYSPYASPPSSLPLFLLEISGFVLVMGMACGAGSYKHPSPTWLSYVSDYVIFKQPWFSSSVPI